MYKTITNHNVKKNMKALGNILLVFKHSNMNLRYSVTARMSHSKIPWIRKAVDPCLFRVVEFSNYQISLKLP